MVLVTVVGVLGVAPACEVAPVDAEVTEGYSHGGARRAWDLEARLEGRSRVVHGTTWALRVCGAERNHETSILWRRRLYVQVERALAEPARIGE
eukprot:6277798-Pyramimonas_sp.AAC.1